ncbi:MAG: Ribosomal protein L11 methyltransferase [Euryarchaeota archaeon UBA443]|nr:MAG: Ribosomal protein L11 methyltransferase [Euryarchaeota archaeon UBA443]
MRLSSLVPHPCQSVELEQYPTEGNLAAAWLTKIDLGDGFEGKHVLDLGAGNGILGIGAAFLKARHVTMVECDPITVDALQSNVRDVDGTSMCTIIEAMVDGTALNLEQPVDMVIMNPPWGVQTQRADRVFFETIFAMKIPIVHFIHSIDAEHLLPLARSNGYELHSIYQDDFRLPAAYAHHSKNKASTRIRCYRLEKMK